jgi:hypothetical protein
MHVNPVILTLTIVLIAVFAYMQWKKKQQREAVPAAPKVDKDAALRDEVDRLTAKPAESPETVYMNLRDQALETSPGRFAALPDRQPEDPYGAVMELGIPNSVVTLACFADGDAGLYYKTGGGMKGGIGHEAVRKVAKEFVALAKQALPKMERTTSQPLPDPDRVRFYVLTPQGIFTTETDRETLGESQGELSVLFYAGQEVVTQMRQVQEQRGR